MRHRLKYHTLILLQIRYRKEHYIFVNLHDGFKTLIMDITQ